MRGEAGMSKERPDYRPDKYQLGLAGEMRVCSELLKKGYDASIVFGNAKSTDIVVTEGNKLLRIEVKTSQTGRNFVTGFFPKYTNPNTDRKSVV